ncbi:MAG: bifunctional nuclease family protein [Bacteroidia bacterium]|nr:bifunctional nuclease family protein [Bacteroidia bacterium]MDW8133478.1 bifunctional nuclease family protein [Bacteroidia bacterium]
MPKVEMEVAGLSRPPTEFHNAFVVVLREKHGHRRLPIVIGFPEAHAINVEIEKFRHPRPLTHDLFINTLSALNVSLTEVTIHKLQDSTFYAYLILDTKEELIEVDCRPSDGIALALRAGAPIYCEEEVLQKAGQPGTEEEVEETQRRSTSSRGATREELERLLEEALAREDYETAARLRDELRRLKRKEEEEDE